MATIAVVHGPNLNLLGERDPEIYGTTTLQEIDASLTNLASSLGHTLDSFQSNHEGALVDRIQWCKPNADALLINAAAYTHTSVAIRDAVDAIAHDVVVIEVHLSIPSAREEFRRESLLSGVVRGRIEGFGALSYLLALRAASELIAPRGKL